MRKIAVLLLITLLWAGSAYAADGVVSFNFENWGSVLPDRAAGVVEVANWNDSWLDNGNNTPMTDLRDNAGATTTTDVEWLTGTWGIYQDNDTGDDTAGTRNVALMKGYLDKHAPEETTFTVTEIPYEYYDLYVYFMADVQGRAGSVTDGTMTYYFQTDRNSVHFTGDPGSADYVEFKKAIAMDAGSAVPTNYAVFEGLSGPSQTISASVAGGGGIAGFQIVEIAGLVAPSEGQAIPQNDDGTVGTVNVSDLSVTDVDLTFKAGRDPNFADNGLVVNPDIDSYIIHLQTGAPTDPNLLPVEALPEVGQSTTDPNRLFLLSEYQSGSAYGKLKSGTTYEWQVEQVMIDPNTLLAYGAGDPNNILSPVWSFTTASAIPEIVSDPDHVLIDKGTGEAQLTFAASAVADNFRWFKVGREEALTDGEIDGVTYAGTDTTTLTVSGMDPLGSEDAQYYAIAYNGVPDGEVTQESEPTASVWVWYPREVNHYKFDSTYTVDSNSFITDSISGFDGQLMSADTGEDVPVLDPNNAPAPGLNSTNSMYFNNPRADDPNHVDGQYVQMPGEWPAYKDVTISAWIYFRGGADWQRILELGNDTGNRMTFLVNPPDWKAVDSFQFEIGVDGTNQEVVGPDNSVPQNEWVNLTVTLTGDTAKAFVNGEYVSQNTELSNDPIAFGPTTANYISHSTYGADTFNGYMDDLRVWNYALSTDEVAHEYLNESGNDYVCDTENYDLVYDWNDNCIIDLGDFAEFASEWLVGNRILPD